MPTSSVELSSVSVESTIERIGGNGMVIVSQGRRVGSIECRVSSVESKHSSRETQPIPVKIRTRRHGYRYGFEHDLVTKHPTGWHG